MTKTRLFALAMLLSFALGTWGAAASMAAPQETMPQGTVASPSGSNAVDSNTPREAFRPQGTVLIPDSSVERFEDVGVRAHTNYVIFVPAGHQESSPTPDTTFAEYPASMACVYKVGPPYAGCVPVNNSAYNATGGWGAIALVDAYDNPNAASDLAHFSSYFGLPAASFLKVYANTSFGTLNGMTASCSGTPKGDVGWGGEEDLDIEWAHAMAPSAKIILVEACSSNNNDLFFAELVAAKEVIANGYGDISNSWGGAEFAGEVALDSVFRSNPYYITYFASAGDSGWGAQYPSSSPWVVSAGGTTVNRDASGNFLSESCWSGSGGGVSAYEKWQSPPDINNGMGPWASFQYPLYNIGQTARQTPDLAFNADPSSGVYVYDTYGKGGWLVIGGTSLSSPALAGIVNTSRNYLGLAPYTGGFYTDQENNLIYSQLFAKSEYNANFYDVTTGSNGTGHNAIKLYDQCTGVGTPRGHLGK